MARENDSWVQGREEMRQEREELRLRLELNEARTKNTGEMLSYKSHQSHKTHQNHDRWRKLEIPIFLGEDAYARDSYQRKKGCKSPWTMVALEGRALSWYQWWERCNPSPTWESFKIAVVRRFQPSMIHNPFELLLSLKQEGSVEAYVEEFEKYAGALKENKRLTKISLRKAILIEQKNLVVTKKSNNSYTKPLRSFRANTYNKVVTVNPQSVITRKKETSSVGSVTGAARKNPEAESFKSRENYKRLTSAEMSEKRERGLCFNVRKKTMRMRKMRGKGSKISILCVLTKAMISSWSERMTSHTGTETRPRLLWEAAVGNFPQWAKA
ncbi:hypothetical protein Lal_00029717 [Lupinus albus]|nr:hypothetical protein Lal_00029717 [Lupinus albus]